MLWVCLGVKWCYWLLGVVMVLFVCVGNVYVEDGYVLWMCYVLFEFVFVVDYCRYLV